MFRPILYLGDTSLTSAAAYLAGLLTDWRWEFDYVPSDQSANELCSAPRKLFIVSDYPSARLAAEAQARVVEQVTAGAGLLMIGGWESYHGLGGDWDGTPLGDALPVEIAHEDDRVNSDRPVLVAAVREHAITDDLPWRQCPPVIGGYNRFTPRAGAQVLLEAHTYAVTRPGEQFEFAAQGVDSLLVTGAHGQGRTAALATDVAPHWVGPLVDWGSGRVQAQAAGAEAIEVGDLYAQFFRQLVGWTGQLE